MAYHATWSSASLEFAVTEAGEESAKTVAVSQPFAIVGRSPNCDLRLSHVDVSYRHALICTLFGRLVCIDLQSRTGTRLNGERKSGFWFAADDRVSVGPYQIETRLHGAEGDSARRAQPTPGQNPLAAYNSEFGELPYVALDIPDSHGEAEIVRIDRVVSRRANRYLRSGMHALRTARRQATLRWRISSGNAADARLQFRAGIAGRRRRTQRRRSQGLVEEFRRRFQTPTEFRDALLRFSAQPPSS